MRTEWLLDHLTVTTRRTSIGRIARVIRQINRRGRTGIWAFTSLLDARSDGEPTQRSHLERQADELLALTSLPKPQREHPLPALLRTRSGLIERLVDRAWPEVGLILEIEGGMPVSAT